MRAGADERLEERATSGAATEEGSAAAAAAAAVVAAAAPAAAAVGAWGLLSAVQRSVAAFTAEKRLDHSSSGLAVGVQLGGLPTSRRAETAFRTEVDGGVGSAH